MQRVPLFAAERARVAFAPSGTAIVLNARSSNRSLIFHYDVHAKILKRDLKFNIIMHYALFRVYIIYDNMLLLSSPPRFPFLSPSLTGQLARENLFFIFGRSHTFAFRTQRNHQ